MEARLVNEITWTVWLLEPMVTEDGPVTRSLAR